MGAEQKCPVDIFEQRQDQIQIGHLLPAAKAALAGRGAWPDIKREYPDITDSATRAKISLYLATAVVVRGALRKMQTIEMDEEEVSAPALDTVLWQAVLQTNEAIDGVVKGVQRSNPTLMGWLGQEAWRYHSKVAPSADSQEGDREPFWSFGKSGVFTGFQQARDVARYALEAGEEDPVVVADIVRASAKHARYLPMIPTLHLSDFQLVERTLHISSHPNFPYVAENLSYFEAKGERYVDLTQESAERLAKDIAALPKPSKGRIGCPALLLGSIKRAHALYAGAIGRLQQPRFGREFFVLD